MVNTLSKLNCCFRAQGWRVVPLIRLARLAVRLAQVCQCSFNHTVPNSKFKDKPQTRVIFNHGVQFSLSLSHSQSPLTVIAGSILPSKHLMRFVAAESTLIGHFRVAFLPLSQNESWACKTTHMKMRFYLEVFQEDSIWDTGTWWPISYLCTCLYIFCFHHFKVSSVI